MNRRHAQVIRLGKARHERVHNDGLGAMIQAAIVPMIDAERETARIEERKRLAARLREDACEAERESAQQGASTPHRLACLKAARRLEMAAKWIEGGET